MFKTMCLKYRLVIRWQIQKVAQLFYCQNKFSRVCGDLAKWPDDRLWNSFKQLLKEAKQTKTVRNDRNHQKRIETMQTKKSPNDNVNDSNAERNALLDLDLTCWIILSAKFSVKYIDESKNDWRSSCVLLDSTQAPYEKPHEPVSLRTQKEVLAHAFFLGCMFCNQVAILFHIFILFLVRIGSDHNLHIFKKIYIFNFGKPLSGCRR